MPTFRPKKRFILSGSNMNFTEKVRFGADEVEEFAYVGTTGLSGVVPADRARLAAAWITGPSASGSL